ncbi:MAG: hypothetical protein M3502_07600 [Actinomycetota bacterium]|nr:hypothetical protein [Actinomycetota bacterium]
MTANSDIECRLVSPTDEQVDTRSIEGDPHDVRRARHAPGLLREFNEAGVLDAADVHVAAWGSRIAASGLVGAGDHEASVRPLRVSEGLLYGASSPRGPTGPDR